MPVVVNRGSANVDAQRLPINRLENFDGVGEGVEEPNGHPGRSLVRRNLIANRAHCCWHDPHPTVFNDRTSTGRVLLVPKLAGGSSVAFLLLQQLLDLGNRLPLPMAGKVLERT